MPFNVGPWELIAILVVVLLAFGAKRLPEVGAAMGKGIREFKKNIRDVKESIDAPDERPTQGIGDSQTDDDDGEPKRLSE